MAVHLQPVGRWKHLGKGCIGSDNLLLSRVAGWVAGVDGMMKLTVSQWIIPSNSLRLAPVSQGDEGDEGDEGDVFP